METTKPVHIARAGKSIFIGVMRAPSLGMRNPRRGARPWRAQLCARGRNFYLGAYDTQEEAARAYDNAAYYFGLEGYSYRGLNFPQEYAKENYTPEPSKVTVKARDIFRAHLPQTDTVLISAHHARLMSAIQRVKLEHDEYEAVRLGGSVALQQLRKTYSTDGITSGDPLPVTCEKLPVTGSEEIKVTSTVYTPAAVGPLPEGVPDSEQSRTHPGEEDKSEPNPHWIDAPLEVIRADWTPINIGPAPAALPVTFAGVDLAAGPGETVGAFVPVHVCNEPVAEAPQDRPEPPFHANKAQDLTADTISVMICLACGKACAEIRLPNPESAGGVVWRSSCCKAGTNEVET